MSAVCYPYPLIFCFCHIHPGSMLGLSHGFVSSHLHIYIRPVRRSPNGFLFKAFRSGYWCHWYCACPWPLKGPPLSSIVLCVWRCSRSLEFVNSTHLSSCNNMHRVWYNCMGIGQAISNWNPWHLNGSSQCSWGCTCKGIWIVSTFQVCCRSFCIKPWDSFVATSWTQCSSLIFP